MTEREIIEAQQEEIKKLRALLREALRQWIVHTPNIEEVLRAWNISREAGLS